MITSGRVIPLLSSHGSLSTHMLAIYCYVHTCTLTPQHEDFSVVFQLMFVRGSFPNKLTNLSYVHSLLVVFPIISQKGA